MAVEISAGDLKWNVVLKKPTATRNASGSKLESFTEVATVRAKVDETSQRLQGIAPALLHTDTVYFRYATDRQDINESWLLNYNGKDHTIYSVEFLGREKNSFIKVIAKKHG